MLTQNKLISDKVKDPKFVLIWNEIVLAAQTTNGEDERLDKAYKKSFYLQKNIISCWMYQWYLATNSWIDSWWR